MSDPAKVAQLILRLAASEHLPAHLLLGSDAAQYAGQAETTRAKEAEQWREVSLDRCGREGTAPQYTILRCGPKCYRRASTLAFPGSTALVLHHVMNRRVAGVYEMPGRRKAFCALLWARPRD